MRIRHILFCSLVCAAVALGQDDKPASVFGVVVDSMTGAPLPRAHVILGLNEKDNRTYGAMTGGDGRFSITGIAPGSYLVTTARIGFSMPAGDASDLVLRSDDRKEDLRLTMLPAGSIAGRVINTEGDPVQGVEISVVDGDARNADSSTATTDSKGSFRIGGLGPGRYRLKATPENRYTPPEQRTDGTVDVQDAPTWYPGSLALRQSGRIAVSAGKETDGVEIRLARMPIIAVSGKVQGLPARASTSLWIGQPDGSSRTMQVLKADGTFRLWRLNPGKYSIFVTWKAPGGESVRTAPVEFEVAGSNIDKLVLRLIPPADLSGHIQFQDDGARPPVATVARLVLRDVGIRGAFSPPVEVAQDGSFQSSGLPAGRYRIIPSWGNGYVASMQLGETAIDGSLLDLSNGTVATQLTVRVSPATGSVSGSVSDEKGSAAGARVALVFDGDPGGVPARFATVGAGGMYSFGNVAPGKYKLVAVQELDRDYVEQSGVFDDYADSMESIEIHPAEKLTHDLKRRMPDGH